MAGRETGSYFLYERLDPGQRRAVFRFYRGNSKVESIREEIVRQLSSG